MFFIISVSFIVSYSQYCLSVVNHVRKSKFTKKIREIICTLKRKHIILRALKLFCAPGTVILSEEGEFSPLPGVKGGIAGNKLKGSGGLRDMDITPSQIHKNPKKQNNQQNWHEARPHIFIGWGVLC